MTLVVVGWTFMSTSNSSAQVVQADYDFDASGIVAPAGVQPPGQYAIAPVGYYPSAAASGSSCDSGGCDSMSEGIFGSGGGGGGCSSGGCGIFGGGGGCSLPCGGCGHCGSCVKKLSKLRHFCIFCRGQGCSACQLHKEGGCLGFGAGGIAGTLGMLMPYREAGLCSQRWYDVSLEMMLMGHNTGASDGVNALTSEGAATTGAPNIVMRSGDANAGDMETGYRLSGALMIGAGSNIEATWIGGHEWNNIESVYGNGANLFSFISDFGTQPIGGLDDTDRSLTQRLQNHSEFDSVEINYRRRTVWPCCRFQGSWLVGLRYIGYDDSLAYQTIGEQNNGAAPQRFFESSDQLRNDLFGAQVGADMWWNICPGVSLGVGGKTMAFQNNVDRQTRLLANSLGTGATVGSLSRIDGNRDGTVAGEFEFKLVYRLSHSFTVRSSYYLLAIDDVAFGGIDGENTRAFVNQSATSPAPTSAQFAEGAFEYGSLVNHGFSIGAEYAW